MLERKPGAAKMSKGTWWLLGGLAAGGLIANAVMARHRRFQARRTQNQGVSVLIVGAGVVGSTYALWLARWGIDVTLLVREARLQELRAQPLRVQDVFTRRYESANLPLVTTVSSEDDYDLVIVAVRYTQVLDALEVLKPLARSTPILVLQHNPAGAEQLAERLGERHVLMGFPATGGVRMDGVVRSLPLWLESTLIGESDGANTQRLRQAASILRRAGLKVEVQRQIVLRLKTQAASTAVLAGCLYQNAGHVRWMASRPERMRLYLGALREAYRVLEANALPITSRAELVLLRQPEWLQAAIFRAATWMPWVPLLIDHYLLAASDEMAACYAELMSMARRSGIEVPLLASLEVYFPRLG
jgi:2-dehydropantoate 2-reductase